MLNDKWVERNIRDDVLGFLMKWRKKTEISLGSLLSWVGISRGKFCEWQRRFGKENSHNAPIPRNFWITEIERENIIRYFRDHPLNGYRRLSYMMIDDDIVYVCPGTVYNVLKKAGLMSNRNTKASKKGQGFDQPKRAHEHWHVDITYINLLGTFYYLCSVLDGHSRFIVHWELKEAMKESDVEIVIEGARERFPGARTRVISDNGPQFIAKDFKEYIRLSGMTHVRTAPYYPQSNGKIERWHGELKRECIRQRALTSLEDAVEQVGKFIHDYNCVRLHSAIGYVTPRTKLDGQADQVIGNRRRQLAEAKKERVKNWQAVQRKEGEKLEEVKLAS